MIELLPCPLCEGEAEFERMGTGRVSCIIGCTDCGLRLETGESGAMCGRSWNTRPKQTCSCSQTSNGASSNAPHDEDNVIDNRTLNSYVNDPKRRDDG